MRCSGRSERRETKEGWFQSKKRLADGRKSEKKAGWMGDNV